MLCMIIIACVSQWNISTWNKIERKNKYCFTHEGVENEIWVLDYMKEEIRNNYEGK